MACLCSWGAMNVAAACPEAKIEYPSRGAVIAEARPEITWQAVPGAKRYRVQIESRVPEGETLVRIDTVAVATRFMPPGPLTDARAAVKLSVSADCGEAPVPVATRAAWFVVDATSMCPMPRQILRSDDAVTLHWETVEGVARYDVAVFAMRDGRTLAVRETHEPRYRLSVEPGETFYVMVRSRCALGRSVPAYAQF